MAYRDGYGVAGLFQLAIILSSDYSEEKFGIGRSATRHLQDNENDQGPGDKF